MEAWYHLLLPSWEDLNEEIYQPDQETTGLITGREPLVLLTATAATGSVTLAHSVQTACFVDNWARTADKSWKIQREIHIKFQT